MTNVVAYRNTVITKEKCIVKMIESIYGNTNRLKMANAKKWFIGSIITDSAADELFVLDEANDTIGMEGIKRECHVNVLYSPSYNNSNKQANYLVQMSLHVVCGADRWYNKEFIMYEDTNDGLIYSISKWNVER